MKLKGIDRKFIKAVKNVDLDQMKKLLDQGANIHAERDFAILCSIQNDHLPVIVEIVYGRI